MTNASNGETGAGAVFDFADALGTREVLEPGEVTSPFVVRLQFGNPSKIPPIRFEVEGHVEQ